jgi:hypothetical protein
MTPATEERRTEEGKGEEVKNLARLLFERLNDNILTVD